MKVINLNRQYEQRYGKCHIINLTALFFGDHYETDLSIVENNFRELYRKHRTAIIGAIAKRNKMSETEVEAWIKDAEKRNN